MLDQQCVSTAVTSTHFFYDWTFWSFVVAALALVSSLAGPVSRRLKATRLVMEVHPRIALDNNLGNPQANIYMDLRNTGGRDIRVSSVSMTLTRDGRDSKTVDGQIYFETTTSQEPLLLVPFNIRSGENWAHPVKFYALPDRKQDQATRALITGLRDDINMKRAAIPKDLQDSTLVHSDKEHVDPLIELFNKLFFWTQGEYTAKIEIKTDPAKASISKYFRFVIYENDEFSMRKESEFYSSGEGVYFDGGRHVVLKPPISLI